MYKGATKSAFTFHQRSVYNSSYLRRSRNEQAYQYNDGGGRRLSKTTPPNSPQDSPQIVEDMQLPFLKKPPAKQLVPVFHPPCVVDVEAVKNLEDAWRLFKTTSEGAPDESIVVYKPNHDGGASKDFVPFDVEKYLTERLLKDVCLDPKILTG